MISIETNCYHWRSFSLNFALSSIKECTKTFRLQKINKTFTAQNMPVQGFSFIRIFWYKCRIKDSVLIQKNEVQKKPIFYHIFCSDCLMLFKLIKDFRKTFFCVATRVSLTLSFSTSPFQSFITKTLETRLSLDLIFKLFKT